MNLCGSLQSGYLGACRTHGIDELAEVALGHLFRLDPQNSGHSVLVLNLHANRVRVIQIRDTMKEDNRHAVSAAPDNLKDLQRRIQNTDMHNIPLIDLERHLCKRE